MLNQAEVLAALDYLRSIISFLILARILMSWINPNPDSPIVAFLHSITEPILGPIRSLIYNVFKYQGMLDFSPIVAILLLNVVFSFLRNFVRMVL